MSVKTAFCSMCQRTVYLGEGEDLRCPVCASPLVAADVDEERVVRIGKNESLFREVNERIKKLTQEAPGLPEREAFVCECGANSCSDLIHMTPAEYEEVRGHAARFAVIEGHEIEEAERMVEDHGTYRVVEKLGAGRQVAEELDPRHS